MEKTSVSPGSYQVARDSVAAWPQQLLAGWRGVPRLRQSRSVQGIVVCGMGGSALAADIVRTATADRLRKPLSIVNGYELPAWANRRTMVVCASYSGRTRETVSCLQQAIQRRLPLVVVAKGGALVSMARAKRLPLYQIDEATLNPSRQPRLGLGFQVGALLQILRQCGALVTTGADISRLAKVLHRLPVVPPATLRALRGRAPLVLGVGLLAGAAHAVANQFNENAKVFAAPFVLPEADHHLLEGLGTFTAMDKKLVALILTPSRLSPVLGRQVAATLDVLKRQGIALVRWRATAGDGLAESLQAVRWGALVSIAAAERAGIDPLAIPWVNLLKKRLA